MSRIWSQVSGMTIVRCDYLFDSRAKSEDPGCTRFCSTEFRSASVKKLIPTQLEIAGWTGRMTDRDGTQDFCPQHRPPHITMEDRFSARRF
jgi:hypothetical protein